MANLDEVQSRAGVDRLIADCATLLDHLTLQPDNRLDWCFEETRGRVGSAPPARLAAPPEIVQSKADFLQRLTELHRRMAGAPAGTMPLDPVDSAFLIAARDFLSSLARPVTVDTIRITRAFVQARPLLALLRPTGRAATPVERCGHTLARQMLFWQTVIVVLVVTTVCVSIYALVGRGLVVELHRTNTVFAALSTDMLAAEQRQPGLWASANGAGAEPGDARPIGPFIHQRYCEQVVKNPPAVMFGSREQQTLCDREAGFTVQYRRLFERLVTWHQFPPASLIPGVEVSSVDWDPTGEPLQQVQELRITLLTAEVVLQAVAEYLLPCLYAMLGALAASLRHIARRTEEQTLEFSDDSVAMRNLVLGLLFGAVIGLFASQIGTSGEPGAPNVASLTPAALSLLAGYSVAQVFQFFDALALRVFGPRQAAG